MTFRLGLTGSIGMGKSTTARMFVEQGCALWDADASVRKLYERGGEAVEAIGALFPEAVRDGAVDRAKLKAIIADDKTALSRIEAAVHPLVVKDRQEFIEHARADIVVLDIPLLFETGAEKDLDAVVCVTVSPELQRQRALTRGTMTVEEFEYILSKQIPSHTKCAMSDYVVDTTTMAQAEEKVVAIVREIRGKLRHA